jgi:hypothetical protein
MENSAFGFSHEPFEHIPAGTFPPADSIPLVFYTNITSPHERPVSAGRRDCDPIGFDCRHPVYGD